MPPMSPQKPRSLQDILKSRQQEEFVGREEQLALFCRNPRPSQSSDGESEMETT